MERCTDFHDDPVLKTPCFQCRGGGFDLWWGTKIPHICAVRPKEKANGEVQRTMYREWAEAWNFHAHSGLNTLLAR